MSANRNPDPDEVEALSRAISSTDAARRAGWAKAYDLEQRVDDLSRDLNVAQFDRDMMRRALSFCAGFVKIYLPKTTWREIGEYLDHLDIVADAEVVAAGKRAGRDAIAHELASLKSMRMAQQRKSQQANRDRREEANEVFKSIKQRVIWRLCRKYGFPNGRAMFDYLETYRRASADNGPDA